MGRNCSYKCFTDFFLSKCIKMVLWKEFQPILLVSRAHDINHPSFIFKPLHSPSANSSTIMFNFQSRKTTIIVSSLDECCDM